ncbi:hypothetical protein QQS21_005348 [Conoideocrella luteorostrata]|uniref:BTB domain-containing protein n=1 Tax=Conoideocrella luteorostrata TaxID=1105319 RepID=A0AAJ0CTU5_9HYPO|nr:hypothetical protein QQS21_005348 [Conoideocrella luteorostrata]
MAKRKGTTKPSKEVNARAETSPYTAPHVWLHVQDESKFTILSSLLPKCPKLPPPSELGGVIHLDISYDIGHTFVHYLFTDTYQCLKPEGVSPHDKLIAEFTTSIRVYILARELGSILLERLTRLEIERLGKGLRFPAILDLVRSVYPNPSADDTWFSDYLKCGLKAIFQSPSDLLECSVSASGRQTLSVSDLLFENMVALIRDHVLTSQDLDATPDNDAALEVEEALEIEAAPEIDAREQTALVMPAPDLECQKEETLEPDEPEMPEVYRPEPTTEVELERSYAEIPIVLTGDWSMFNS